MATTVLHVEELTVSYLRSDRTLATVVSGVGFEVDQGEVLGLAGESGSGKSTTLLAACGYRSAGSVVSGRTILAGVDLLALPPDEVR